MDNKKPDLIIHPEYYDIIMQHNLSFYFNVLTLKNLKINSDLSSYIITDNEYSKITIKLQPFYCEELTNVSGIEPSATSYWFNDEMPIYNIEQNGPRYVIWTKNDPLTVCCTVIDRVENFELYDAIRRAKEWSFTINEEKSIIVFDLDRTLINDNCNEYEYADKMLEYARKTYDLVVLWSHGSPLHVDDNVSKFIRKSNYGDKLFDLILRYNGTPSVKANKNLLYIYNYFPNCIFSNATLVDDSIFNWTPEYNKLIIPHCNKTLQYALSVL